MDEHSPVARRECSSRHILVEETETNERTKLVNAEDSAQDFDVSEPAQAAMDGESTRLPELIC
jgi:hypothetical protein